MTHRGSDQARTKKPLKPSSDNPSLNSELHAATEIQSSVTPEDYPPEKRDMQVKASVPRAGVKARGRGKDPHAER